MPRIELSFLKLDPTPIPDAVWNAGDVVFMMNARRGCSAWQTIRPPPR